MRGSRFRTTLRSACAVAVLLFCGSTARSGGSAENAVVVVDPTHPDSARVANAYIAARKIPATNVLYMTPDDADGFVVTLARNLAAFEHELATRGIGERIDFVVVAPTGRYRTTATGLLTDQCFPAGHVAVSSCYTLARMGDELAGGTLDVTEPSRFFSLASAPVAFSSNVAWLGGSPSTDPGARRYFIGAMLGYTGTRGNTVEDLETMIARSAAADGTFPDGTFYFAHTTDALRSGPRHDFFPAVETALEALGANAVIQASSVPIDQHDVLGVMTGDAVPQIAEKDFTIIPGAFCDHLTSWAADFAQSGQTKLSAWIAKGASGSVGAVEEPCNYPGKFPRPEMHLFYFQGATLGEAYFRSAQYAPFQMLLYGDPLTRPWAHVPVVSVVDAPTGPVTETVVLTPSATTTHPGAAIASFDLLVDGVRVDTVAPGGTFSIDTLALPEGPHELRVLADDDSTLSTTGRWIGALDVDNHEAACMLAVDEVSGDLGTAFSFTLGAMGEGLEELRLFHNGRVVAAVSQAGDVVVHGRALGAGVVALTAEAVFGDGRRALSPPVALTITADAPVAPGPTPLVYSYTKRLRAGGPTIVELPATFTDDPSTAVFDVTAAPQRATVLPGTDGAFRLIEAPPAEGDSETLRFRVTTPSGTSSEATVTLVYGAEPPQPLPPPPTPLTLATGRLRDKAGTRRDSIKVTGELQLPVGHDPATFDPAGVPTQLELGDVSAPLTLEIPAADPRWKFKRKWFRYVSPKGTDGPRIKLRVRPDTGAFRLLVKRAEFAVPHANPMRVALATGGLEGELEAPWVERPAKPGSFDFAGE